MSKAIDPAGNYGKVADHLKKAAAQMKSGNKPGAGQSLARRGQGTGDLMEQVGDAQSLMASLESLNQASMCIGSGQGWGCAPATSPASIPREPRRAAASAPGATRTPNGTASGAITGTIQTRAARSGFAPGVPPTKLEPGTARLVKAGSDVVFQLHYTANGKAAQDQTRVGINFAKEPPKVRASSNGGATIRCL